MTQKKIIFLIALGMSILSFKESISMRNISSRNDTQGRGASTSRGASAASTGRGASTARGAAVSTSRGASTGRGAAVSTSRGVSVSTGRSASAASTGRGGSASRGASTSKMINPNSQLLIQPGDVATTEITDALTVQPETLLLHASIVTKEPMPQADYTNLINTQVKPLAQLIAECKETLQTSDTLTTTQIEGLKGRFVQLLNTAPVLVKIPTLSSIIPDARIISGQTALGTATIPVTIANLDANAYTNSQLGNIVLVSKKFITSSQFDILSVTHWNQKLAPLANQAKSAAPNSAASSALKNEIKTILATGWANAFVPESAMPESILIGQNFVNAATVAVTTANLASLANDQFAKLVIKSIANLPKTQFDALAAQVQANITPNLSNPDTLKTQLATLLATNQVTVFVAPHQTPATLAAQTLLGAGNEAAATVAVTTANLASLFDDQFAKMVIRSINGLTQEQINALNTQLASLGSDVATVKANLPALLATNQVTVFVGPHQAPATLAAQTLLGAGNEAAATVAVTTANLASLFDDQFAKMVIRSVDGLTQEQINALNTQLASLGSDVATVKANLPALLATNQVAVFVGPHQAPATLAAQTLLGAGNEAAATVAVTTANLASLFDDQFAKMVIRSVDGLTQEQINALNTQLASLGSDVATVKTNLPALLATNQVAVFVGPHQEALVSSMMNIETGLVADITGRSIVDTAGIDGLTGEQIGNIIFVSRQNIPESEYQTARQEYTTANLVSGLNIAKSNPTNTTIINQVKTTVKTFMQKPTISGKVDIYAPAAAPAGPDNTALIAQIQAISIPADAYAMKSTSPTIEEATIKLVTKISATLKPGASDPSGLLGKITDNQSFMLGSNIIFGDVVSSAAYIPTGPLNIIKDSLIQGLTDGILNVTITP